MKSCKTNSTIQLDLDNYITEIKRLHANLVQSNTSTQDLTLEELNRERTNSSEILNTALSDYEPKSSVEEKATKIWSPARARQAEAARFALPTPALHMPLENSDKVYEWQHFSIPKRTNDLIYKDFIRAFSVPTVEKYGQSKLQSNLMYRDIETFTVGQLEQQLEEDEFTQVTKPDKSCQLVEKDQKSSKTAAAEYKKKQESQYLAGIDMTPDQELKDSGSICIEDDYDHTVDIDSWIPDDLKQPIQEMHSQDDIPGIFRRKLESIEEIDQFEDEDLFANETSAIGHTDLFQGYNLRASPGDQVNEQTTDIQVPQRLANSIQATDQEPIRHLNDNHSGSESYTKNQELYDNNEQNRYQENFEYPDNYDQRPARKQQLCEYSHGHNQPHTYDAKEQYIGYENRQRTEEPNVNYTSEQYEQYNRSQPYQQDAHEEYEPYSHPYVDRQDNNEIYEYESDTIPNQYKTNQAFDSFQEPSTFTDDDVSLLNGACTRGDQMFEYSAAKQLPTTDYCEQSHEAEATVTKNDNCPGTDAVSQQLHNSGTESKKIDVIKPIPDSDSESLIEINLSNTESEFDFC